MYNCDYKDMLYSSCRIWDLAIVDPEYGRGEHGGVNRSGFVKQKNGNRLFVKNGNHYEKKDWDKEPVDLNYFDDLLNYSKDQIIWGCNYYKHSFGEGRIVWDKVNEGSDQSDCEIAYTSLHNRIDLIRYMWRGMMQGKSITEGHIMQGNKKLNEKRIHPTQKPVLLYKWLLSKYPEKGASILDTHGGSMSIAVACWDLGFDIDVCEKDSDYFYDAVDRFEEHIKQLTFL